METENVVLLRMSREDTPTPSPPKKEKKIRCFTEYISSKKNHNLPKKKIRKIINKTPKNPTATAIRFTYA